MKKQLPIENEPEFISPSTLPATIPASDNLPANVGNRGTEEIAQEDLIIPRAQLLQPTAEGLRDMTKEFGVNAGQIINNLTKEVLPDIFVPIFYYKEYMRFNPRQKEAHGFDADFPPGKMMWKTRDANDPRVIEHCKFGPNGEPPVALTSLNFFSIFKGNPMPVIITFTKSSYRAGKNLLSLAKFRGGDMFSKQYRLSVEDGTSDKGTYFTFKVSPAGNTDQEAYNTAESYFKQFGMRREDIKTHDEVGE